MRMEEDLENQVWKMVESTFEQELRGKCEMVDHGDYQPHHEFKRLACTACGGMHWEQPMKTMARMRFCPWCGAVVTGWRWLDE